MNIPTPDEFTKAQGYKAFPRKWNAWLSQAREAIQSAQPAAGRHTSVDEHPGKGTIINVDDSSARRQPGGGVAGICPDCEGLADVEMPSSVTILMAASGFSGCTPDHCSQSVTGSTVFNTAPYTYPNGQWDCREENDEAWGFEDYLEPRPFAGSTGAWCTLREFDDGIIAQLICAGSTICSGGTGWQALSICFLRYGLVDDNTGWHLVARGTVGVLGQTPADCTGMEDDVPCSGVKGSGDSDWFNTFLGSAPSGIVSVAVPLSVSGTATFQWTISYI